MTEVHVVRHDNSDRYRGELEQYFRGRYDVFVRERGWKELERPDGRDTDQFDTEEAIHLLAIDKHRVIGGMRLNPSMGPTLFTEVFPHLCLIPLVGSPDIYEDRAPERGVIGRVRQGWPDHHNAAILATSIVRSSQT